MFLSVTERTQLYAQGRIQAAVQKGVNMKRILTILLSLVLCLSMSVSAFATDTGASGTEEYDVYLSVEDAEDALSVVLTAETAVTDGVVTITYDTSAVSIDEDKIVPDDDSVDEYSVNAGEAGTVKIAWVSAEAQTGTLFTLGFVPEDSASVTENTFSLDGTVNTAENTSVTLGVVFSDGSGDEDAVDKSALQTFYTAGLVFSEEDYTAESWAVFSAAMKAALAVLENEDATQEEVDAALSDLYDAINALTEADTDTEQETVDKSVLQAAYDSSLNLSSGDYTEESWSVLAAAQKAALAVLEDEDATQEEVDAALDTLLDAIKALESNTADNTDEADTAAASTTNSKTGDTAPVYILLVILLTAAAAAAAVLLYRNKKRAQ